MEVGLARVPLRVENARRNRGADGLVRFVLARRKDVGPRRHDDNRKNLFPLSANSSFVEFGRGWGNDAMAA